MSLKDELRALKERSEMLTEAKHLEVIHKFFSEDFTTQLTQKMGYAFTPERIQRIAKEARVACTAGMGAAQSYSHAINAEIIMYGDPNYNGPEPVGILNVRG